MKKKYKKSSQEQYRKIPLILYIIALGMLGTVLKLTLFSSADNSNKNTVTKIVSKDTRNNNSSDNIQSKVSNTEDKISNSKEPSQIDHQIDQLGQPHKDDSVEVILTAVGDCTLGRDDKFSFEGSLPYVLKKNNYDYSYIFKNVSHIFKDDDITIANLEGTFTNSNSKAEKQFTFKAPPEYAKILTAGSIEGVNLSNNHIRDYLDEGFKDTIAALESEGINYFGEGNVWIKEIKGIKFGFLGYKGFYDSKELLEKVKNDIKTLKAQNCVVVINFHWGEERPYEHNSVQRRIAHHAIDNGADLIIGHHPHVIQGIEQYKNKLIFYSLGNFAFGGNKNPKDKNTIIPQIKFKFRNNLLESYDLKVIPAKISSVDYINDYCPTPAKGDSKTSILKNLNKLSPNLGFEVSENFHSLNLK